jgi:hypothetical protein
MKSTPGAESLNMQIPNSFGQQSPRSVSIEARDGDTLHDHTSDRVQDAAESPGSQRRTDGHDTPAGPHVGKAAIEPGRGGEHVVHGEEQQRIELLVEAQALGCALDQTDSRPAAPRGASPGGGDHLRAEIDAHDLPGGAGSLEQEGEVGPRTAAHLQHGPTRHQPEPPDCISADRAGEEELSIGKLGDPAIAGDDLCVGIRRFAQRAPSGGTPSKRSVSRRPGEGGGNARVKVSLPPAKRKSKPNTPEVGGPPWLAWQAVACAFASATWRKSMNA